MNLKVVETFTSIQGESTHAGKICFFIRLAGCNLSCSYCDTAPAKPFDSGKEISIPDLVEAAKASAVPMVASHSTCAALQSHCRAKPDEVIRAVADSGGCVVL